MKCLIIFFVTILIIVKLINCQEKYSDKYDSVMNVEEILDNDDARNSYYNCFMGTSSCPNEAAEYFKGNMAEAVVTSCSRCTEWQISAFDKIASWYSEHDENAWNAFVTKFIDEAKAKNIVTPSRK
ncbi:uncharacterized protein LOC122851316 [Aphidius gifuensis]